MNEASPVPALEAKINYPRAVLLSTDEKQLYITDSASHMIKSYSFETGLVSIVAGSLYRDTNLTTINYPTGLAINPAATGVLYFVDSVGVKKINQDGSIELVVGGSTDKFSGDGGLAISAGISATDIEFDPTVNTLYIADSGNNRVRVVGNGYINTIAGNGVVGGSTTTGILGTDSPIFAGGVSVSDAGEVHFADRYTVSKIDMNGILRHVAGNGQLKYLGDNKLATQSQLFKPRGVAVSPSGDVFISDISEDTIRRVGNDGIISTFAGGSYPSGGAVEDNVPALNTFLNDPSALEFSSGELFIADTKNYRVRKIKDNLISTVSGSKSYNRPHGIALFNGMVYIADPLTHTVLRIAQDGTSTVIAGNGTAGYSGDGGLATQAQLFNVSGVAVLPSGEIVIADTSNHRIRKINTDGIIQTICGTGSAGFSGDNILATSSQLNMPTDVEVSPISGEIFIVDTNNHRIRKINSDGKLVTIAGTGAATMNGDGQISTFAAMNTPTTISISPTTGQIFIADYENRRIRKLDPFFIESFNYNLTTGGELKTEPVKKLDELDAKVVVFEKTDTISVSFPPNFNTQLNNTNQNLPSTDLTLVSSVYQVDKNKEDSSQVEKAITSPIVSVSILQADGTPIKVKELTTPIDIHFKDVTISNYDNKEPFNYTCMYFNTEVSEWKNDGVETVLVKSNVDSNTLVFSMTCKTSHLTSFSVIDLNLLKQNKPREPTTGLSDEAIIAIVVSVVGSVLVIGVVSAIIIVTCCVLKLRNKNGATKI